MVEAPDLEDISTAEAAGASAAAPERFTVTLQQSERARNRRRAGKADDPAAAADNAGAWWCCVRAVLTECCSCDGWCRDQEKHESVVIGMRARQQLVAAVGNTEGGRRDEQGWWPHSRIARCSVRHTAVL